MDNIPARYHGSFPSAGTSALNSPGDLSSQNNTTRPRGRGASTTAIRCLNRFATVC